MIRSASMSGDGLYRYSLTRAWNFGNGRLTFILLHPRTPGHETDDRTIDRCIAFGMNLGYSRIEIIGLFAALEADTRKLWRMSDPVGPENWDTWDKAFSVDDATFVAAWGSEANFLVECQVKAVRIKAMVRKKPLMCFGVNKGGIPRHPLTLKRGAQLVGWRPVG